MNRTTNTEVPLDSYMYSNSYSIYLFWIETKWNNNKEDENIFRLCFSATRNQFNVRDIVDLLNISLKQINQWKVGAQMSLLNVRHKMVFICDTFGVCVPTIWLKSWTKIMFEGNWNGKILLKICFFSPFFSINYWIKFISKKKKNEMKWFFSLKICFPIKEIIILSICTLMHNK